MRGSVKNNQNVFTVVVSGLTRGFSILMDWEGFHLNSWHEGQGTDSELRERHRLRWSRGAGKSWKQTQLQQSLRVKCGPMTRGDQELPQSLALRS